MKIIIDPFMVQPQVFITTVISTAAIVARLKCEHCNNEQNDWFADFTPSYRNNTVPFFRFCEECQRNSKNQKR